MYDGDSFFSLTVTGRIGLVILSLALAALTAAVFVKTSCRMSRPARLVLAPVYLWVFVWLSPQVYYLYYVTLFDHLPLQNVVQFPPGPFEIAQLLSFAGKSSLSRHSAGLLGWGLIVLAVVCHPAGLVATVRSVFRR